VPNDAGGAGGAKASGSGRPGTVGERMKVLAHSGTGAKGINTGHTSSTRRRTNLLRTPHSGCHPAVKVNSPATASQTGKRLDSQHWRGLQPICHSIFTWLSTAGGDNSGVKSVDAEQTPSQSAFPLPPGLSAARQRAWRVHGVAIWALRRERSTAQRPQHRPVHHVGVVHAQHEGQQAHDPRARERAASKVCRHGRPDTFLLPCRWRPVARAGHAGERGAPTCS
jgi:hypothetical protein